LLTARLPSLRDRQKARLEKESAVAELVGETVKKKAKVLKVLKVGNKIKKIKK
jgi:hypothetical protein